MIKNKCIEIAINHIHKAHDELKECSSELSRYLEAILAAIHEGREVKKSVVFDALAVLQLEDIITQRIGKIEEFLFYLDKEVDVKDLEFEPKYLEDFAWENEVDQEDIDRMFDENKG